MPLCNCGCGLEVKLPTDSSNRKRWLGFIKGHFWRGRKHSPRTKETLSRIKSGKPNKNKGKKFDYGWKVSLAKRGIPNPKHGLFLKEYYKTHRHPMSGKFHSEETKEEMSRRKISLIVSGKLKPYNKESGKFFSNKNNSTFMYRSHLELKAFRFLEKDDSVIAYKVESFSIPYTFDEKRRRYVPDLIVTYKDGRQKLIEIKPSSMINLPINQAKAAAAIEYCSSRSIDFCFWTEITLKGKVVREIKL